MWECDWDKIVKTESQVKEFVNSFKIIDPIYPRDALFGGRTNAVKLHYKCKVNEKIFYSDFTSLYPHCQKNKRFPLGHPIIIRENFQNVNNYFGLIKCIILPPRKLYIPVLPVRINGKLLFPLCNKCALENISQCPDHNESERGLTGTFCTPEVQHAIKMGYKVLKIYEIWQYDSSEQYNPETKKDGIFTEYINMFLAVKQESTGYPSNVKSTSDEDQYIKNYFENEGVILNKDRIKRIN